MSGKTPMRVRGKRSAEPMEKWNQGKQRKGMISDSESERSRSVMSEGAVSVDSPSQRKRKRRSPALSRLEQLPTEVLQHIFVLSGNIELPRTSLNLASSLSSPHLYRAFTNQVLDPVLGGHDSSAAELRDATRLMNSKFFTPTFLQDWMKSTNGARCVHSHTLYFEGETVTQRFPSKADCWLWFHMEPHKHLLPPIKLLQSPITKDKENMLGILRHLHLENDPKALSAADPVYHETAREALETAVVRGSPMLLAILCDLGLEPETKHLQLAVIEGGCDQQVVKQLIDQNRSGERGHIDFLDPSLWAWAEKAKADGDGKGEWLLEFLRREVRAGQRASGLHDEDDDRDK